MTFPIFPASIRTWLRLELLVCLLLFCTNFAGAITIKFWAVTGTIEDAEMYRKLAAKFEAVSGIHVDVTPLSWGEYVTKYFASMAAGLPPDIGITNLGGPSDYGRVGGVIALDQEFPKEIGELKNRFYPGLLPQFMADGHLYGLPTDLTTLVCFYRTDIFNRYNIKVPETWSALQTALDQLAAQGFHYNFGFTERQQWSMLQFTMPFHMPFAQELPNKTFQFNMQNPLYQKGAAFALDLWYMHDQSGTEVANNIQGMFASDDPAIATPLWIDQPSGYYSLPINRPEINGKWDVAPWPKADAGDRYNIIGGCSYVIFRDSQHKREAFEWLKYVNSVESQEAMVLDRLTLGENSVFYIPPLHEIWSPSQSAFWGRPELKSSQPLYQAMLKVVPHFQTLPILYGAVESGRLEESLLARMGTYIVDWLNTQAGKHNLSRWQYIQAWGNGQYLDERTQLKQKVNERLKTEYSQVEPAMKAIVEHENVHYAELYGNVINNYDSYMQRTNALDIVKRVALVLMLFMVIAVLAIPRLRSHLNSYFYIALPLVLVIIFVFVPAVTAFYLSFTEYHPVLPLSAAHWRGIQQYIDLLKTGQLVKSLWLSIRFVMWGIPLGLIFSLTISALLNNKLTGQRYWRFIFFAPMVTSIVSISLIFTQLYLGTPEGWINGLLLKVGLIRNPIIFLKSEGAFMNCVIWLAVWHGLAFNILILLAGLQQIPQQLYEAAEVDGANWMRKFVHITMPGLRPQIVFLIVIGLIGGLQVFEPIFMLGGGAGEAGAQFGPNQSGLAMVPYVFRTGFEDFKMGEASAIAYILFFLILGLTVIQFKIQQKHWKY